MQPLYSLILTAITGIRSRTRRTVIPEKVIEAKVYKNCAYRVMIPSETVLSDPEIAHLIDKNISNAWIGHGRRVMAYPMKLGTGISYYALLSFPSEQMVGTYEPGDVEEMKGEFHDFDPVVRRILSHVDSCVKWKIAELPNLRAWVSKSGKVVLIGDAAHAMVPYLSQVGSQFNYLVLPWRLERLTTPRVPQPALKMDHPYLNV